MQIPSLVVRSHQGMLDVPVVQPPGAIYRFPVFILLRAGQLFSLIRAMRRRRQDVRRAVGKPDAGPGKRHLHHVLGKIACGMIHYLICGSDAAACCVIVRAKMRGDAAPAGRIQKLRQARFPSCVQNRLGRFNHHLKSQRALFQSQRGFQRFQQMRERGHLFRNHDFWKRNDEICG